MRKVKKLSNKLMAILLSASMVFAPAIQSMPVYAAEPVIEEGSAGTLPENTTTDEPVTDNNDSDTPAADNGDSENKGTEDGEPGNPGTENGNPENPGTENGDTENPGTENGDTENPGNENGDPENPGTENGDSENSGTEDGDTENPEDPDAEDGDPEDSGDTGADESLEEVQDLTMEAVDGRAAGSTTSTISKMTAKGWNESIYAEVSGIKAADVAEVSYSGDTNGKLSDEDLQYLVRDKGNIVRIDILGLKKNGTYSLTVKALSGSTKTVDNIKVYAYDRSGYAHFNYNSGVGAYKDDGTLKDGAIVLYVTDKNKNDVELKVGNKTVKGIGNILNSVGQDTGNGKTSNGGKPNTNAGIIKALALTGKPLVVRFIGTVSESALYSKGTWSAADEGKIDGLTDFSSLNNGGSVDDNGHMARIQSGKDITLEGIGSDSVIDGWGFHYIAEGSNPELGKSFEVRNLTFINTPEDAVGMEGQQDGKKVTSTITSSVERCWVHNNEFYCPSISGPAESDKKEGDGSVDFKRGNYFTCSYNYFESCHKTNLVGSASTSLQYNLSYHHNYYYRCGSRGPLSRNANIHMYNNIYEQQTSYAMDARANAYIFAEYNLFYASKSPHTTDGEGGGTIKSYKDSFSSVLWNNGKGDIVDDKNTYIPNNCQYQAGNIKYDRFDLNFDQSYIPNGNYDLQTDFNEMRAVIASQLGVQDENPIPIAEITPDNYSMVVKSGSNIQQIKPSFSDTPGKISKTTYAFNVEGPFNISVKYGANIGILVNDAGENLLEGNGELINLPAGRYMIQPTNIDPSKTGSGIWKDCNIDSIEIEAYDKDAHYHEWVEDTTQHKDATCTEKGRKVYKCSGCTETKGEEIPLIAHSYVWVVDKAATETEAGEKHQECSVCHDKKAAVTIPAVGSGGTGGGDTGIVTKPGDYVLTFEGTQKVDPDNFFDVTGPYTSSKGSAIIEGKEHKDGLKLNSKASVTFNCNDGATLTLIVGATYSGKTINVDGQAQKISADGTIVLSGLSAGSHVITKGDTELGLLYVAVSNGETTVNTYTITLDYNDDSSRDEIELLVVENTKYQTMSELVPSTFTKRDYKLEGLYTDPDCTDIVIFPYTVTASVTLYANWIDNVTSDDTMYYIIFDTNGGSLANSLVEVSSSQIYQITQKPTKDGCAFAGWYTEREGGQLVDYIDGSTLKGNCTVYAHWNSSEKATLSLDCSKDLDNAVDGTETKDNKTYDTITTKKTINGFTLHVLPGTVNGTKYYMTLKETDTDKVKVLYTNGVLEQTQQDPMLKAIEFEAPANSVLVVETALSGKPESGKTYRLVLAKDGAAAGSEQKHNITEGKNKVTETFEINEAGKYYLYPEGDKGLVYYSLKVTEQQYTIVYKPGSAAVSGDFTSVVAKENEEITLPAYVAAKGYTFTGWSLDGTTPIDGDKYTVDSEDASADNVITITALYTATEYNIAYDAAGGNLPTEGLPNKGIAGQTLTLGNCTPANTETHRFIGWSVRNSEPFKNYLVRPDDAVNGTITLKAVYREIPQPYTIKYNANGGTLPDGKADTEQAYEGDIINLPVCAPPPGKQFLGWNKKGSTDKIKTYTVKAADADSDRTITFIAVYDDADAEYCNVTLNPDGGELSDGDEATSTVKKGEEINPGKCKKKGYKFIGWSVNGEIVGIPYTVTGDVTLKAEYEEGPSHEGISIIGLKTSYEYTGAKIIPNIGVVDYNIGDDGKVLTPGVDYTVKYKDNKNVGTAKITVTGKGNYAGKDTEKSFKIIAVEDVKNGLVDLKGAKIAKINSVEYTGEEQHPDFTLTLKGKDAVTYTYNNGSYEIKAGQSDAGTPIAANVAVSNNINKGTATILITGKVPDGKTKATSVKKTFKITAIDLAKNASNVKVTATPGTYSVKGAAPGSLKVTYDGKELRKGTDYTVKYTGNKKVTTSAKIVITGKGNYAKKVTGTTYEIKQLDMSKLEVKAVNACEGIKAGKVKATVLDGDGNILKPSQYTINVYSSDTESNAYEASKSLEKGTIYVEAKAKDTVNLIANSATGKAAFTVAEKAKNIAKAKIKLNKDSKTNKTITKTYNGDEQTLKAEDLDTTLRMGTDYVIAGYSNNVNKGTATAIIKGIGSYSGTKTVKFKIVGKTMDIDGDDGITWDNVTDVISSFMKKLAK